MEQLTRFRSVTHRWARFVAQRWILGGIVGTFTSTSVEGADNLEGLTDPFVVVANHSSHMDATVLVTRLPYRVTRRLAVAAAADYFFNTWWRRFLTGLFFNSYPVHRTGQGKGKGMSQRLIAEGVPILIFPEGTRARDGVMKAFKPGAAALCIKENVPCVPVALIGTHDAMPVGRSWPKPGRPPIRLLVGRPMRPRPGEKARDFNDRVAARVRAMLTMQTPYVLGDHVVPGGEDDHAGGADGQRPDQPPAQQEEAS